MKNLFRALMLVAVVFTVSACANSMQNADEVQVQERQDITTGGTAGIDDVTGMADGGAAQTSTLRWEDYTQTAVDPSDDRTIWYVGDYLKPGNTRYSTRIAGIRMPGK